MASKKNPASSDPEVKQAAGLAGSAACPEKCSRDQEHMKIHRAANRPLLQQKHCCGYSTNNELTESSLLILNTVSASNPATDNTRIFLLDCASLRNGMVSVTTT